MQLPMTADFPKMHGYSRPASTITLLTPPSAAHITADSLLLRSHTKRSFPLLPYVFTTSCGWLESAWMFQWVADSRADRSGSWELRVLPSARQAHSCNEQSCGPKHSEWECCPFLHHK
jgi:hypothetical protein